MSLPPLASRRPPGRRPPALGRPRPWCAAALALVAALAGPARAGQFAISELGSRTAGRGFAATALTDTPNAIFYNPANLTLLRGLHADAGLSFMLPRFEYTPVEGGAGGETTRSESRLTTPPNLSLTYDLGTSGAGDLAVGLGLYTPYGSSLAWPSDWVGREQLQELSLQVVELTPAVALRPHELVSVGVGLRYLPASLYLRQAVRFGTEQEGKIELSGAGAGLGARVGVAAFPLAGLTLGLTWQSPVTLRFEGESDFDFEPPFDTEAQDTAFETSLPLAQTLALGAGYDVTPELNVQAVLEWQGWGRFESLDLEFASDHAPVSSPRQASDGWVVKLGGEYELAGAAVRAGYVYDRRTLPERTVGAAPPDSDKHLLTLGGSLYGQLLGTDFGVHAHFANVFFRQRTSLRSPFPAQWRGGHPAGTMAYIFGVNLSAALDTPPPLGRAAPPPEPAPELQSDDLDLELVPLIPSDSPPGASQDGSTNRSF